MRSKHGISCLRAANRFLKRSAVAILAASSVWLYFAATAFARETMVALPMLAEDSGEGGPSYVLDGIIVVALVGASIFVIARSSRRN